MVITGVPPGASLSVYPLIYLIDGETPDSDADLLYISEGGSIIVNLYRRFAIPFILPTTGYGALNFNYKPDIIDMISRLRFVIQISGTYSDDFILGKEIIF